MNTQLVDTLVQIIQSLSQEERVLLDEKLKKPNWRETLERIEKLRSQISVRRGAKPFDPPIEEIIHQMREERDQQILSACFPNLFPDETANEG
jgi:hypothetical protein